MEISQNIIENKTTKELLQKALINAVSYSEYRNLVDTLSDSAKTTGELQQDHLIEYTKLNARRMKRLDKTLKIIDRDAAIVTALSRKLTWLVLTESWCGDAAQTMPVMNKIASLTNTIDFKVIQRDQNVALMDRFLSNGAQAIPKVIMLDPFTNEVLGEWGPRPKVATKMVIDFKKENGALTAAFKQDLQVWYNKDKGQGTVADLLALLSLK